MKREWLDYMKSIGLAAPFLGRAEQVLLFFEKVHPDAIDEIFINEYSDKEGNRHYESLWLFSKNAAMEAKRFLQEDDFDSTPLMGQVKYWTVKKTEYDFDKASPQASMTLEFSLVSGVSGNLHASGLNCDHLKRIFLSHIVPNAAQSAVPMQRITAAEWEPEWRQALQQELHKLSLTARARRPRTISTRPSPSQK